MATYLNLYYLLIQQKTIDGKPHYVVLDTNIVLHAIDILESTQCFYDIIIPQTVLEEVKIDLFNISEVEEFG